MIKMNEGQEINEVLPMIYNKVLCVGSINMCNVRMVYEKKYNTVWVYVGNTLVSNICLKFYDIKYNFTDIDGIITTTFYNIIRKRY